MAVNKPFHIPWTALKIEKADLHIIWLFLLLCLPLVVSILQFTHFPEIWISKGKLFQSLLEKDIYFDRKILNVILEFVHCAPPHKLTIWKRYLALSFSHQLKHIKDGCSTMLWVVMVYLFCATRPMKEKQGFTFWDSFQSHKLFPWSMLHICNKLNHMKDHAGIRIGQCWHFE